MLEADELLESRSEERPRKSLELERDERSELSRELDRRSRSPLSRSPRRRSSRLFRCLMPSASSFSLMLPFLSLSTPSPSQRRARSVSSLVSTPSLFLSSRRMYPRTESTVSRSYSSSKRPLSCESSLTEKSAGGGSSVSVPNLGTCRLASIFFSRSSSDFLLAVASIAFSIFLIGTGRLVSTPIFETQSFSRPPNSRSSRMPSSLRSARVT